MPYCAIITCRNKSQLANLSKGNISYHRFPSKPQFKAKWIIATGRRNWFPTKTSTICSAHFVDTDFATKPSGNRYLNNESIPTVDVWLSSQRKNVQDGKEVRSLFVDDNQTLWTPRERKLSADIIKKELFIKRLRNKIKQVQTQNKRYQKKIKILEGPFKTHGQKVHLRNKDLATSVKKELTDRCCVLFI